MQSNDIKVFSKLGLMCLVLGSLSGCSGLSLGSVMGGKSTPAATNLATTSPTGATVPVASSAPAVALPAPTLTPTPLAASTLADFEQATAALKAGRLGDAERMLRALTASHPHLSGPHANLGLMLRASGKLPEAIVELERAVALDPTRASVLNLLGVSYRESGAFDKARAVYEQALALDPNDAKTLLNLGILHDLYLGDSAKAQTLFGRYLALVPTDALVIKWVAELKNRKPQTAALAAKEKP